MEKITVICDLVRSSLLAAIEVGKGQGIGDYLEGIEALAGVFDVAVDLKSIIPLVLLTVGIRATFKTDIGIACIRKALEDKHGDDPEVQEALNKKLAEIEKENKDKEFKP